MCIFSNKLYLILSYLNAEVTSPLDWITQTVLQAFHGPLLVQRGGGLSWTFYRTGVLSWISPWTGWLSRTSPRTWGRDSRVFFWTSGSHEPLLGLWTWGLSWISLRIGALWRTFPRTEGFSGIIPWTGGRGDEEKIQNLLIEEKMFLLYIR